MNWKQALKDGGTRFAVYVTQGNRHYFSHADGYYWELADGELIGRTKLPGKLSNDGWEPVYEDEGLYADLLKAYEKLVPPNIPAAPPNIPVASTNGVRPGPLRQALTQGNYVLGSIGKLSEELQNHDFLDEEFTTKLDSLIQHATHLRSLL